MQQSCLAQFEGFVPVRNLRMACHQVQKLGEVERAVKRRRISIRAPASVGSA
jgi:hypothetical protein